MKVSNTLHQLLEQTQTENLLQRKSNARTQVRALQVLLYGLGFGEALNWSKFQADGDYGGSLLVMVMGLARLGRLIEYIPYPVTIGFTAGIAVVIATLQLKDVLGLRVPEMPEHFVERVSALAEALPTAHGPDVAVGALTLLTLLVWPRVTKRVPRPSPASSSARGPRSSPRRCGTASTPPPSRAASTTGSAG